MSNSNSPLSPLFFSVLLPELQWLVGQHCDEATRMCLYLTCKSLYYTPVRTVRSSLPFGRKRTEDEEREERGGEERR